MRKVMLAVIAALALLVVIPGQLPGVAPSVVAAAMQQQPEPQAAPPEQVSPPAAQPAQPAPPAQREQVDINVNQPVQGAIWYRSPLWIAIGAMALVLFAVIVIMMTRGGSNQTVVRG